MVETILILAAVALYGLLHSLLASLRFKRAVQRGLGMGLYTRFYRFAYNLLAAITLLPVIWLSAALPDVPLYRVPSPWGVFMLLGQSLAGMTLIAGVLQTGLFAFVGLDQLLSGQPPEPRALVTDGLYGYVRHPLYTAGLAFMWLSPLMTRNLLALYVGASLYLVIGALYEERKLVAEYGAVYEDYRARTPMLLPFVRL